MTANGFLDQGHARPLSFGMVLALHGAAIAAVLLIKGPTFERRPEVIPKVYPVRPDAPPPPLDNPPPQSERKLVTPPISRIDLPPRILPAPVPNRVLPNDGPAVQPGPVIGNSLLPQPGTGNRELASRPPPERIPEPVRDPVRTAAQFDPRFMGALRPPYPASEERAEREGQVTVRVTIGTDGRVKAVERVSATNDAFWRATQRQALSRWRFKPATLDGRPVESSKVVSIAFRLDER